MVQAMAYRAYRGGKVPNVRPLYWRRDDEYSRVRVLAGIFAQTPMRPRRDNMMLTLAGAQAEQFEHVSLGSAKDVSHKELRLPKFVRRRQACNIPLYANARPGGTRRASLLAIPRICCKKVEASSKARG